MSLMHHNALRTGLHWKCYPKCTLSPIPAHQGDDATSGKTSVTSSWVSDENHMKRLWRLYIRHLGCTIPVTPLSPCSLSPLNLGGKLGLGWRSRGRNRNQKKKLLFFLNFSLVDGWRDWFCFVFFFEVYGLVLLSIIVYYIAIIIAMKLKIWVYQNVFQVENPLILRSQLLEYEVQKHGTVFK